MTFQDIYRAFEYDEPKMCHCCRFFKPFFMAYNSSDVRGLYEVEVGECHAKCPCKVNDGGYARFPFVQSDNFCGEFKPWSLRWWKDFTCAQEGVKNATEDDIKWATFLATAHRNETNQRGAKA